MFTANSAPAAGPIDTDAVALLGAASNKARVEEKRKRKNRVFAKESRERGKQYVKNLKARVEQLEAEIAALRLRKGVLQVDNAALSSAGGMPWLLPGGCLLGALNDGWAHVQF